MSEDLEARVAALAEENGRLRAVADLMAEHFPQIADMSGPRTDGSEWVSWKCWGCDAPETTGGPHSLAHESDCVYRQYREAVGRCKGETDDD